MEYKTLESNRYGMKILENNGIKIENIDGAAFNEFLAGKDGVVKGVLDECIVYKANSNMLKMGTGLILVHGVRIKMLEETSLNIPSNSFPATPIRYRYILTLELKSDKSFDVSFKSEEFSNRELIKEDLYKTNQGKYELELFRYTIDANGYTDIVRVFDIIAGGGSGTTVTVGGVVQDTWDADTKLDKATNVSQILYGTNDVGDTSYWNFGSTATRFSMVYRSGDGTASIADPIQPLNITNKQYVDTGLDGKLDKATFEEKTADIYVKTSSNTAKIENLTNILLDSEQMAIAEVSQAFTTRQTADGENIIDKQNVFPKLIKGNTVKSSNLFDANDSNIVNNVRVAVSTGGVYDAEGYSVSGYTAVGGASQIVISGANTQTPTYFAFYDKTKTFVSGDYKNDGTAISVPTNAHYLRFDFVSTATAVMVNKGSTALPFRPYFSGLKNAYLQSVKSTGRNLIPYPYSDLPKNGTKTMNGITFTDNGDGSITVNGTATAESFVFLSANYTLKLMAGTYTISGQKEGVIVNAVNNSGFWGQNGIITTEEDVFANFSVYIASGTTVNNVTVYPMLNHGSTALPYEPYTEETYQLPQTLELGEWDSLNPQTGELTRQTETITLDGSKAWITNQEDGSVAGWYSKPEHWYLHNEYTDDFFISSKALLGSSSAYNFQKIFPSGTTLEEVQAYYDGIVVAGKLKIPTVEKLENTPKFYKAWNNGSETQVQGATDNSADGAMCTLTNDYFVKVGGEANEQTE